MLMNDFDRYGFLGEQIDVLMAPVLERNAAYYSLIEELNVFCNEVKNRIIVNPDDVRSAIASMLFFLKISNGFQAIVLLSKKGLGVECIILTRSLLEVTFPLRILSLEENFARQFVLTEKAKQLRLLNVIINNKEAFSPYISEFAEELRVQLRADIESKQIRTFTVEELAKRANMHHFYQLAYRHFSEEVHTTVKSLESYVVSDEHGYIQTFEKGPQLFEVNEFNTAAFCLLIALESINDILQMGLEAKIKSFEDRILGLSLP